MSDSSSNLLAGGALSMLTAVLLATQGPLSALAARQLSVAKFVGVTAAILLLCVPFMLGGKKARRDFGAIIVSASNLGKFGVLLVIGLFGQVLFALGLGKGNPVVIASVLNLDPFWAALVAYLIVGKKIPTTLTVFCLCLFVAFAGAMMIAVSQSEDAALTQLGLSSFVGAGIAFPIPILTALSGTLVGKWFGKFDESASLAVTFLTSAAVALPAAALIALMQSDMSIGSAAAPAIALLALGTVLSAAAGRIVYQKALTVTGEDNGFVSMFFLFIPAFTALLSLLLSFWVAETKFKANMMFLSGLLVVAIAIFLFSWRSWRAVKASSNGVSSAQAKR